MIKNIELNNFRIFDNLKLETNNGLVIISGKNARGKTSIIEAIYIAGTTKSHRENDLKNVKGGALGSKLIMGLVTGGAFLVGLIDGILRPLKCRNRWVILS